MKYLEPNIIIVDDVKNEIQGILDYYIKLGLGCKWFNASYYDEEADVMPEKTFSDVNLLFLDLFYAESFDAEQCANWVKSLLSEKTFYILILWTKDPSKADEVLDLLKKYNRTPFIYLIKNKSEFHTANSSKYDFTTLFEQINEEIEKLPALEEVQIWKNEIKKSSNIVLGNLTKTSDPVLFTGKLKKIIISHGGNSIKVTADNDRKRFILFDALNNILISNSFNNCSEPISEVNQTELYDLSQYQETPIDKELNSWFHFKLQNNISENTILPGLLTEFKDNEWKTMYSIHDDKNVSDYISRQDGDPIITSIAMVLSRPCDLAQQKFGKNIKLLSGLKIVNPVRKEGAKKEFQGGISKPDSIKIYDHLHFNDSENDITILFDFRYSFSIPENIFKEEFINKKIFNKELLSEIQVEYSSYSSRLGITQIF